MRIVPFPFQREPLHALLRARKENQTKNLVVMASGLGKTVVSLMDFRRFRAKKPRARLLFLCNQTEIVRQTRALFERELGPRLRYGTLSGRAKNLHRVDCLFATFQTMKSFLTRFDKDDFDFILVDESHHSQAKTYKRVIAHFTPTVLLGITATPDRHDGLDIREIYGEETYRLGIEDAMARRLLPKVDYRLMSDEINLARIIDIPEGKLSIRLLNKKVFVRKRDEEIVSIIRKHAESVKNPRILLFCPSIAYCDRLGQLFADSVVIHSKIATEKRDARTAAFREGRAHVAITVDCFNEGVDIPEANIIVFLRSTQSARIFLQQLGRGMRPRKGKRKVLVLDFVANCERIRLVTDLYRKIESIGGPDVERDPPFELNIRKSGFKEAIVDLEKVLERLRPKMVSDYPHLLAEYSSRNVVPATQMIAGTNKMLQWACSKCQNEWSAPGYNRVKGIGCPACSGRVATPTNNLRVTHPALAKEYSPKNTLSAEKIVAGTNKKVLWRCSKCQNEWRATGNDRVYGKGCPACSGRVATPTNNLRVTHPALAKEYSSKNQLPVTRVKAKTGMKLWWICSKCQYEWPARGYSRAYGSGCPACSNRAVTATNNLAITHPMLAKEYSPKNALPATQVIAGTNKGLLWVCAACGNEWRAKGVDRVRGTGCAVCARVRRKKK